MYTPACQSFSVHHLHPKKTDLIYTSPLKMGPNAPKGKDRLPTINFQVLLLLISERVQKNTHHHHRSELQLVIQRCHCLISSGIFEPVIKVPLENCQLYGVIAVYFGRIAEWENSWGTTNAISDKIYSFIQSGLDIALVEFSG